jgi:hypothetical protein
MKLKVIKSKEFTYEDNDYTHYTCAYKGRVFGVSTLIWAEESSQPKVEKDVMSLPSNVEVRKRTVSNPLDGSSTDFLDIVPKMDLTLGAF